MTTVFIFYWTSISVCWVTDLHLQLYLPTHSHKPVPQITSEERAQHWRTTWGFTRNIVSGFLKPPIGNHGTQCHFFGDHDTKTSAKWWLVVFCLWDIPLMQPNSFLRPDHIRYSVNIEEKSPQQQANSTHVRVRRYFPKYRVSLFVGLFFNENLTNVAPLISKTYVCIGYTQPHMHTHAVYMCTKCRQGLHCWAGIMLLKAQLSGERPQTERGDAVRNVYKAARGRTAEDERAPRALCGLKATQRLVSNGVDFKL